MCDSDKGGTTTHSCLLMKIYAWNAPCPSGRGGVAGPGRAPAPVGRRAIGDELFERRGRGRGRGRRRDGGVACLSVGRRVGGK